MPKTNRMRILFVCGTGIATSTAAENKLMTWLKKRGYNVATSQCVAGEVLGKSRTFNPHAIVTTTKIKLVKTEENGKPITIVDGLPGIAAFNGVPFLTGIGEEQLVDKICEALEATDKP